MYERVAGNTDKTRDKMKKNYDHGSKVSEISPGDWALVKDEAQTDYMSPMYRGPWKVLDRNGVNVHLKVPGLGGTRVVHLNRCKSSLALWVTLMIGQKTEPGVHPNPRVKPHSRTQRMGVPVILVLMKS